jgi:HEPN domain-containing protein
MAQQPLIRSRDFHRAAKQRLTTAEFLMQHRYTLDAYYLNGYVIECSLKSLILHLTHEADQEKQLERIKSHNYETLKERLKEFGVLIPLGLLKRFRRFPWSTDLRYETGRKPMGETRGFIKTALRVLNWVETQLP